MQKPSLLERIAQIIEPKDRPSGYRSPAKRTWQKALYSRYARYFPTPSTQGDRSGIKFRDGTKSPPPGGRLAAQAVPEGPSHGPHPPG
jgi:hypothetical protein